MGQFDNGEQSSLANSGRLNAHDVALDGAAILFDQTPVERTANPGNDRVLLAQTTGPLFQDGTGNGFRDAIRNRLQGMPTSTLGDDGRYVQPNQQGDFQPPQQYPSVKDRVPRPVSNLPSLQYTQPTPIQPSIIESTNIKKTSLDTPYTSETSEKANSFFDSVGRIGSAAFFINRDHAKRSLEIENKIANTELVSNGTRQGFQMARDGLLDSLKTPIQNAESAVEGMYKNYPTELFQGSPIPKLSGKGKILMPHPWELDKLTAADQVLAERYLNLASLRETLVNNWPPVASTKLGRLPVNLQASPLIKAEGLVTEAARFDAAGSAFTGQVTKVLAANDALRAGNTNLVFKSAGAMAGAWVTNTATDVLINTKHGPSKVTWAADLLSPAILLTNKSMLVKFGVVAGSHLVAKLYDKFTEEA